MPLAISLATAPVAPFAAAVCARPEVPLPAHEPLVTRGPTEVLAGLYVQGGAFVVGCPQRPRGPFAGTLTVTSTSTGAVVARQTLLRPGRLFKLALAPGSYVLHARETAGPTAMAVRVTILAHHTVRQDLFIDVP